MCDFDIYTGKTQQGVQHGLGYSVVTKLCKTIKGHWHAIFCDNFFTFYKLIEDLYRNKILCCGTLRSGRKEFPPCLFDKDHIKSMKRDNVFWQMKGPILEITWMDKKAVHAAGTYTQAPQENLPEVNWNQKDGTLERINCPQLISSYNTYMGGVDKNNQEK